MAVARIAGRSRMTCLSASVQTIEPMIDAAASRASRGRRRIIATAATSVVAKSSEPIETIRRKLSACASRDVKKSWPTKACSSRRWPQ